MMALAAWTIVGSKPAKLLSASVGLEKDLETWIEADPSLVNQGFLPIEEPPPGSETDVALDHVRRRDVLGGLIHEYKIAA